MNVQQELVAELEDLLIMADQFISLAKRASKMPLFEEIDEYTAGSITGMQQMRELINDRLTLVKAGK